MSIKIFICYAHEDEAFLKKLKTHLRPLQREGLIDVWHDQDITAGTEWEAKIHENLSAAQIILLLISPDFMASDYCYSIEMKQAMERRNHGEAVIVPVILRPVYWRIEPISKLQALPKDAIPATSSSWHTLDNAFFDIANSIRNMVKQRLQALPQVPSLSTYDSTQTNLNRMIQPPNSVNLTQSTSQDEATANNSGIEYSLSIEKTPIALDAQKNHELLAGQRRTAKNPRRDNKQHDWGDAPDTSIFFGRTKELDTLKQWILKEHCRLVAIVGLAGTGKTKLSVKLGRGGIGKTGLSLKLAQGLQDRFEYVAWRKLLNAPKATDIITDLIKFLSQQQEIEIPETVDSQISRLLFYLRQHRCLLIFDNVETILQRGRHAGYYHDEYEAYSQLFRKIAETPHQSCLLLTSREKPQEVAHLEGQSLPVRSLELGGLDFINSKSIFTSIGSFSATEHEWKELNTFYNGNPLALELAARHIKEVFFGDVSTFLKERKQIFADLRSLLDWYVTHLDDFEKEVMYWLAINRGPILLSELKEDIVSPISKDHVGSTLQSLQRLIPLEKSINRFSLQPVLIEYMTERLIELAVEEINSEQFEIMNTHTFLKALAADFVRDSQRFLILKPISERLLSIYGNQVKLETKLKGILSHLQKEIPFKPGYIGGNILNLLCLLNADLRNYDFSRLVIWQAYLQDTNLQDVNFSYSDLSKTTFSETFGGILSISFSPDGRLLAAGIASNEIRVWQTKTGMPLLSCQGHKNWIHAVAFSPDGKLLASGSDDQTIRLWEVSTGQCLRVLQGHTNRVWSITFSPDGKLLASGSDDQTIRLWEASTGQCLRVLQGHTNRIWSIALSSKGDMLASGSHDQTIRLWEVSTGQCLRVLQGHTGWIDAVALSSKGDMLASGSHDQTIRLWEVSTGQCLRVLQGHSNLVRSVAISPDGNMIVSGSDDQTVRLWEASTGQCLRVLQGHSNRVRSVAFSPDGSVLSSGSDDHRVRLWDIQTGQCLKTLLGNTSWIWSVAFAPNGYIVVSGSEDHKVRLWDIEAGQCLKTLTGHTNRVRSVAFSPDGSMIASGGEDQTVRLWEVKSAQCLKTLQGHTNWIRSVAFSSDWKLVASGGDDHTVRLWDVETGQCLKTLQGHTNRVWSVAFNQNGKLLASGGEDHAVRLWDVETGQCLKTFLGQANWIDALAFSPNGKLLVSGGDEQPIRLWDIESGQCLKTLTGHTNWVRSVAFSPDGRIVVSGGDDGTVRTWDANIGKHLKTLISDRPYERMNIHGATGLTDSQKTTLRVLGAVEENIF